MEYGDKEVVETLVEEHVYAAKALEYQAKGFILKNRREEYPEIVPASGVTKFQSWSDRYIPVKRKDTGEEVGYARIDSPINGDWWLLNHDMWKDCTAEDGVPVTLLQPGASAPLDKIAIYKWVRDDTTTFDYYYCTKYGPDRQNYIEWTEGKFGPVADDGITYTFNAPYYCVNIVGRGGVQGWSIYNSTPRQAVQNVFTRQRSNSIEYGGGLWISFNEDSTILPAEIESLTVPTSTFSLESNPSLETYYDVYKQEIQYGDVIADNRLLSTRVHYKGKCALLEWEGNTYFNVNPSNIYYWNILSNIDIKSIQDATTWHTFDNREVPIGDYFYCYKGKNVYGTNLAVNTNYQNYSNIYGFTFDTDHSGSIPYSYWGLYSSKTTGNWPFLSENDFKRVTRFVTNATTTNLSNNGIAVSNENNADYYLRECEKVSITEAKEKGLRYVDIDATFDIGNRTYRVWWYGNYPTVTHVDVPSATSTSIITSANLKTQKKDNFLIQEDVTNLQLEYINATRYTDDKGNSVYVTEDGQWNELTRMFESEVGEETTVTGISGTTAHWLWKDTGERLLAFTKSDNTVIDLSTMKSISNSGWNGRDLFNKPNTQTNWYPVFPESTRSLSKAEVVLVYIGELPEYDVVYEWKEASFVEMDVNGTTYMKPGATIDGGDRITHGAIVLTETENYTTHGVSMYTPQQSNLYNNGITMYVTSLGKNYTYTGQWSNTLMKTSWRNGVTEANGFVEIGRYVSNKWVYEHLWFEEARVSYYNASIPTSGSSIAYGYTRHAGTIQYTEVK